MYGHQSEIVQQQKKSKVINTIFEPLMIYNIHKIAI